MAGTYGFDAGFPSGDPYAATYGAYSAPAAAGYGAPPMYGAAGDEIRTVFITGFPDDVKERELNNMMRFVAGYEASQMNWKNGQAQGFALFTTGALARAAIDALSGLCFDDGHILRCEMARKNMYLKEEGTVASKRARFNQSYPSYVPTGGGGTSPAASSMGRGPQGYAPVQNTKDNPPCNTLFIGNLGDNVSEAELRSLFSAQAGFKQMKVLKNARNTSCFVEFEDIATATACHQSQQGAVLASSDRGGIRIQFSKNPFGKKRDAAGNSVDQGFSNDWHPEPFDPSNQQLGV